MSEPFIGEIKIFAGNFAPRGWAFCDGQLLAISSYNALFSILGVTYGGDGGATFSLPDLRGRAPVHPGNGPGLSSRNWGQRSGVENVTLNQANLPSHNHALTTSGEDAENTDPTNNYLGTGNAIYASANNLVAMSANSLSSTGGTQSHNNMQPSIVLNYIIALVGVYPSRS